MGQDDTGQDEQKWEYCALVMTVVTDPEKPSGRFGIQSQVQLIFYDDEPTVLNVGQAQGVPVIRKLGMIGWELVSATSVSMPISEMGGAYAIRDALFFKRSYMPGRKATKLTLDT